MKKVPYYRGEPGCVSEAEGKTQLSASSDFIERRARPKEIGCVDLALNTTLSHVNTMRPQNKPKAPAS